jgi:hypothetical protein
MGTSRGAGKGKMTAAVAVLGLLAVGTAAYLYWKHGSEDTSVNVDDARNSTVPAEIAAELPGAQAADIPVALLTDYYEHINEHMPPRDPSGAMQRREKFYRTPHDPFTLLASKLTNSEPDTKLRDKVEQWKQDWLKGPHQPSAPSFSPYQPRYEEPAAGSIEDLAAKSSLSAVDLLEISRAMAFLDGDAGALAWIGAGLKKAEQEYQSVQAGDPNANPLLHELDQTKSIYHLNRYGYLEKRFTLAMALYAPLSIEQRRSAELHAMSLYYQSRMDEAADAIIKVWDDHQKAGDLGAMEKSDLPEMNWLSAIYNQGAHRYPDAVRYWNEFLKYDDGRKQTGERMLVMCLMQAGDNEKAESVRKHYGLPVITLPPTRPAQMGRPMPMTRPAPTTRRAPNVRYLTTRPTTRMAFPTTRPGFRQPIFGFGGPKKVDDVTAKLSSDDPEKIQSGVDAIRTALQENPIQAVDRLNDDWMTGLIALRRFDEVNEFATTGTIAVAADTARIEQLQKNRVSALMLSGKSQQALQAAKGLFNVSGMGFTKEAIQLLIRSAIMAHRTNPEILPQLTIQILANAQEDAAERKKLLAKYGGNAVMDGIPADPAPYVDAIAKRGSQADYHGLYGTGNLLLLSGRVKDAHDVFLKIYQIAPPAELKYASEGVAKLMKAEEGGLGKADDFVETIRPRE